MTSWRLITEGSYERLICCFDVLTVKSLIPGKAFIFCSSNGVSTWMPIPSTKILAFSILIFKTTQSISNQFEIARHQVINSFPSKMNKRHLSQHGYFKIH